MRTCDLHSLLVGARVPGAGHDHSDRRAVLVPHGGAGAQFAIHGVQDDFIKVALQEWQQHLRERQTDSPYLMFDLREDPALDGSQTNPPDTQGLQTDS